MTEQISAYRESRKWKPGALYYHRWKSLKMLACVDSDAMTCLYHQQINLTENTLSIGLVWNT